MMPLESCPTCGSALSILSHQCRNCVAAASKLSWIQRPSGKLVVYFALILTAFVIVMYALFGT